MAATIPSGNDVVQPFFLPRCASLPKGGKGRPDMLLAEAQRWDLALPDELLGSGPGDVEDHCHLGDAEQVDLVRRILGPTIRDDRGDHHPFPEISREALQSPRRADVSAGEPWLAGIPGR
jgi:hypothetical protein